MAEFRRSIRAAISRANPVTIDTAELLGSEILTNALQHGTGQPETLISADLARLRVEVFDRESGHALRPLHVAPTSPCGRGLSIVDALASSWGVDFQRDGKVVWFELALDRNPGG